MTVNKLTKKKWQCIKIKLKLELIQVSMLNIRPSRDTRVTPSKAYWIKLWSTIIKQSKVEEWSWKKIIKKTKKNSTQPVLTC
jgi:hypothetical protein